MRFGIIVWAALLLCATTLSAQQKSAELKRYSECQFGKDFTTVEVQQLAQEIDRAADFVHPSKVVHLLDGYSLHVAYKEDEPFANVKAEQLRAESYAADRQALLDALKNDAADAPNMESTNYEANGFEVYGVSRKALDANVLATYLVLNGKTHTATTIYLLNDYPEERKFNTIEQFRQLRDAFLKGMLECFKQ